MAYRLPPLAAMRLFEAAGRHSSFRLAAEELRLTPSAISHGIRSLERWLGTDLFLRGHRDLVLTATGATYLAQVRAALDIVAEATETAQAKVSSGRLNLTASPTFAVRWLVPRLGRFLQQYPEVDVSIDTAHHWLEFPRDEVDLAIRMGRGNWQKLHAVCLVRERLVPVCSPALAAGVQSVSDLAGQTLLHVRSATEDWAAWGEISGIALPSSTRSIVFDSLITAFEAAAQGLGVAIGRRPLVDRDLEDGRLVTVLGPPRHCSTGYWLVAARESLRKQEAIVFRNWIRSELRATEHLAPASIDPRSRTPRPVPRQLRQVRSA